MSSLRFLLLFTLLSFAFAWSTWPFPHFNQCNESWANITMGVEGNGEQSTICKEGCAMTCISIALYGLNFDIYPNTYSNPSSLNKWLQSNKGYECLNGDCNNLVLDSIDTLTNNMLRVTNPINFTSPSMYDIRRGLDAMDTIILAHNPSLFHFVLASNASWNDDSFSIIDPYFNATVYSYNETNAQFIVYNLYNIARPYQFYAQCDELWANDTMGANEETICAVGCLMTSISMAMQSYDIPVIIDGKSVKTTPKSLNIWLQRNNGYLGNSSNLIESSLNQIPQNRTYWSSEDGMHSSNDISAKEIRTFLQDHPRRVVIANVMNGQHFVLCVDIMNDLDTIIVNDPAQFHQTYSYKRDVVGWRIFDFA